VRQHSCGARAPWGQAVLADGMGGYPPRDQAVTSLAVFAVMPHIPL